MMGITNLEVFNSILYVKVMNDNIKFFRLIFLLIFLQLTQ